MIRSNIMIIASYERNYYPGSNGSGGGSGNPTGSAYYFSSTLGDDSRTATQAQTSSTPWKSLSKLNTVMSSLSSSYSVAFKRGDIFTGSITLAKSGLYFEAYDTGVNPIISGYTDLTWTSLGGNLYESQVLSAKPNLVIINGSYRLPGRFPTSGYNTVDSSTGNGNFTDAGLVGTWTNGEVVVRKNHTIWDKGVISQTGTTINFTPIYGDSMNTGYGYFIQNHINACVANGDWAWNTSNSKIRLYSTSTPTNCKATTVDKLISTNGYSTTFDGIDLMGSNTHAVYAIHISSGGFTIKNSTITNNGDRGIYLWDSPNCIVQNNTITNTNATCIEADTCTSVVVRNNTISNVGVEGQGIACEGHGMVFINGCTNGLAELNSINGCGHNGMNIYFSTNFTAQNNLVDTFNRYKEDGAGIYTWLGFGNGTYTGIKILNNIVLNGVGAPSSRPDTDYQPSFGIYLDDQVANTTVAGNTIAGCAQAGIFLHNVNNNIIIHNTSYNNGSSTIDSTRASQIFLQDDGGYHTGLICSGNILFAKESYQYPFQADYNTNTIGSSFTTLNYNWYFKPINTSSFQARTYVNGEPTALEHSFAAWKTYTGKDANSSASFIGINNTNRIKFDYNATTASVVLSLGTSSYYTVRNVLISGSLTLGPYSSSILIRSGS